MSTAPADPQEFSVAAREMGERNRARMLRAKAEGRTMVAQEQFRWGKPDFYLAEVAHLERRLSEAGEARDRYRVRRATAARSVTTPAPSVTSPRSRGSRRAAPGRRQGSRRGTGSRAGPSDDDDGEPEPPGLRLWRHPRWGSCSPSLLRLLLRRERS